ncbi:MAG TPA: DUF3299 domain-containing protein [Gemmatimonas sp.]|nr:DUF3299 domain-containing protein [Gemmatimonas sp.]
MGPSQGIPNRNARRILLWSIVVAVSARWSIRPAGIAPADLHASQPPRRAAGAEAAPASDSGLRTIDWRVLTGLDVRTGELSSAVKALHGQRVRIPGFIVPLEDFQEQAAEFLLVPYFGACVHMPPPPPNQMIFGRLRARSRVNTWEPVWMEGTLLVTTVSSPYGAVSYQMRVEKLSPYRPARMSIDGRTP